MIREKLSPKKILLITLFSLAVIGMGVLYVTAGSVMDQVPKTEVVKASGGNHLEIPSQSAPSFSTLDEAPSKPATEQPVEGHAPSTPQPAAASSNENTSNTSNSKRNSTPTYLFRGPRASFRQ